MSLENLDDEFRFLASDSALVGHTGPVPAVRRVSIALPDQRILSALRFGAVGQPESPTAEPGSEAIEFVLIHGMGLNAHSFDPTVIALGRPALSVDLAGHGRSDWRADAAYLPQNLAADLVVAFDNLVTKPVVLVGHSLGALTAILVAAQRPQLISALVLVDMTPGVSPEADSASVTEFIAGQRTFDSIEEMVDRAIEFGIGHDRAALTRGVALNTRVRPDSKIEWAHHFAHLLPDPNAPQSESSPETTPDLMAGLTDPKPFAALWAVLEQLPMPISLVRGASAMVSQELVTEWHEHLPAAAVVTLETGHNVHEQDPVGLARELAAVAGKLNLRP
ncbi:alpha/beta hydrolase [Jonesiaceae bacterium BS-20]|uniref:Alpha/beta hydrolase n=1 Tax=Jonesiaceae bacterium BS-20 TaxID=3120821 RepID=A0AAU7DRW5_9MICO